MLLASVTLAQADGATSPSVKADFPELQPTDFNGADLIEEPIPPADASNPAKALPIPPADPANPAKAIPAGSRVLTVGSGYRMVGMAVTGLRDGDTVALHVYDDNAVTTHTEKVKLVGNQVPNPYYISIRDLPKNPAPYRISLTVNGERQAIPMRSGRESTSGTIFTTTALASVAEGIEPHLAKQFNVDNIRFPEDWSEMDENAQKQWVMVWGFSAIQNVFRDWADEQIEKQSKEE